MEISIEELKSLIKCEKETSEKINSPSPFIGKTCIVKAYSEGVFIGDIDSVEHDGNSRRTVVIKTSRRIWSWNGALCCEDIAQKGISGGKLSVTVDGLKEVCGVLSLIEVTAKAKEIIMEVKPSVD